MNFFTRNNSGINQMSAYIFVQYFSNKKFNLKNHIFDETSSVTWTNQFWKLFVSNLISYFQFLKSDLLKIV